MRYRTKVDWWLATVVNGVAFACLVGGVWLIIQNADWPMGLAVVAAGAAILAIGWPTHYELTDGTLRIRAGLFLWKIPIQAIDGVQPSHNPMSAPAWSLKRLRVDYRRSSGRTAFVLISPADRDLFMRDLARLEPQLELRYDHLVRTEQAQGQGSQEVDP